MTADLVVLPVCHLWSQNHSQRRQGSGECWGGGPAVHESVA